MNGMRSLAPEAWWRSERFMASMGTVAGAMLGAGSVRLTGCAPNGQQFVIIPTLLWLISGSTATLDGVDLGEIGASPTQGQLGDFRIPQRGVFAIGRSSFGPAPAGG
jgi:hypothetical protein